jgi:hypothetical protein
MNLVILYNEIFGKNEIVIDYGTREDQRNKYNCLYNDLNSI